jgi:nucleotide-binding universal stress UspA family protein
VNRLEQLGMRVQRAVLTGEPAIEMAKYVGEQKASLVVSVACVPAEAVTLGTDVPLPVYREVLVATDFSLAGNRAVPYACGLAASGGNVHLMHVAEGDPPTRQEEAALRRKLEELVPRSAAEHGRLVRVQVLSGPDVVTVLLQAADRLVVDALVVGTHGHSGLKRAVLGSVAQQVMLRSGRPVLVVRPPP